MTHLPNIILEGQFFLFKAQSQTVRNPKLGFHWILIVLFYNVNWDFSYYFGNEKRVRPIWAIPFTMVLFSSKVTNQVVFLPVLI